MLPFVPSSHLDRHSETFPSACCVTLLLGIIANLSFGMLSFRMMPRSSVTEYADGMSRCGYPNATMALSKRQPIFSTGFESSRS
jgi:hypothetical protein